MSHRVRNRRKPNRKWSEREVTQILDFIIKENTFERPTAQVFYRKFIHQSDIDATWDLLRWKVRYLKLSYKNAESWRNSIDAGLLESASGASAVEGRILKICPHYAKLKQIFGSQLGDSQSFEAVDIKKSDIPDFLDTSQPEHVSVEDFEFDDDDDDDSTNQPTSDTEESNALITPVSSTSTRKRITNEISTNCKKIKSDMSFSRYELLQKDRTDLAKSRLEFERWRVENELELRKEELAVRREELQVKRMEIEKDERVAMYEIDMKYKNKETK